MVHSVLKMHGAPRSDNHVCIVSDHDGPTKYLYGISQKSGGMVLCRPSKGQYGKLSHF